LADVTAEMDIMQAECFGPVASIATFKDIEQAVVLANATRYGLGAVVFGEDESRALNVGRRIEAGMVGINRKCSGAEGAPWVGVKESGFGWHSGKEGHRQFTQPRLVSMRASDA
jgi:acyl-CoA reductase-like NAD-dependent aldehyde dehydrogenase